MALTDSLPILATPLQAIAAWASEAAARRRARRAERRAIAELRGLPTGMMKDLGFDRSEILSVVRDGRENRR